MAQYRIRLWNSGRATVSEARGWGLFTARTVDIAMRWIRRDIFRQTAEPHHG